MADANERYPALMAYIHQRNELGPRSVEWGTQLQLDEFAAFAGGRQDPPFASGLADVVTDLARAKADYGRERTAEGPNAYPYREAMLAFLELPPEGNGYYMANEVAEAWAQGAAARENRTIALSDELRISISEGDHGFSFAVKDAATDERIGSGGPYANKEFAVQEAARVRDGEIERRGPASPVPLYNPHTDQNYVQERAYHAKYYPATPQADHGPELDFGPISQGLSR